MKSMLCLMHLIHHVVHMYIKNSKFKIQNSKKKKKKKKKPFGLGALGLQIISIYFQKNWTRSIGKASNCEKKEKAVKLEKTSTKKKEREVNARIFTKW